MKTFLKSTAIALTIGVAAASAAKADSFTAVSWGGAYTRSQVEAYYKPWEAKTGNTINSVDYSGGLAEMRAQAESGNVTWDLVDVVMFDAMTACDEGLVDRVDFDKALAPAPDGTPPSKDFLEGTLDNECFIPEIVYSFAFAYNKKAFPDNGPKTVADVFDLKKFPGKRTLQKSPSYNLEWALIADGVPTADVYKVLSTEEGVNRAFKKLDTIKDQVVWWTAGAQPPQLMADGEVVMGSAYNGRWFSAIAEEHQPFEMMWDHQAFDIDGWVVPAGGKKKDLVYDFLRFATDTQRLADQAKYISYGPARKSSQPLIGKHATLGIDMAPHMPTNPAYSKTAFMTNFQFWADNKDVLSERFNAWLAK